jgi:hypothetical protein
VKVRDGQIFREIQTSKPIIIFWNDYSIFSTLIGIYYIKKKRLIGIYGYNNCLYLSFLF